MFTYYYATITTVITPNQHYIPLPEPELLSFNISRRNSRYQ